MKNVAALKKKPLPWPVMLAYASVTAKEGGDYRIVTADGQGLGATRAAGCLLVPDIGDRVLVAGDDEGECFVMEVLVKSGPRSEIAVPGDVTIRSENGDLSLQGRAIALTASQKAVMVAPELSFTGIKGSASFSTFSWMTQILEARIKKASLVVGTLDKVCGRAIERIRNSFRQIEGLEEVKADRLRTIVRERFALRAKQASILTEEEVTIDGKKIHLG